MDLLNSARSWMPAFARLVFLLIFALALFHKLRRPERLLRDMASYRLLPHRALPWAAAGVSTLESLALLTMVAGGGWLRPGLMLILLLLGAFSAAIGYALFHRLRAPCSCFGRRQAEVGPATLGRNAILLALAGGALMAASPDGAPPLAPTTWLALAATAALLVALLSNLGRSTTYVEEKERSAGVESRLG